MHTIKEDWKGGYSFLLYQSILYKKIVKVVILFFYTSAYYTGSFERWYSYLLYQSILYKKIGTEGILFISSRAYYS